MIDVDNENGGLTLNDKFFVDFGAEPNGPMLPHEIRWELQFCSKYFFSWLFFFWRCVLSFFEHFAFQTIRVNWIFIITLSPTHYNKCIYDVWWAFADTRAVIARRIFGLPRHVNLQANVHRPESEERLTQKKNWERKRKENRKKRDCERIAEIGENWKVATATNVSSVRMISAKTTVLTKLNYIEKLLFHPIRFVVQSSVCAFDSQNWIKILFLIYFFQCFLHLILLPFLIWSCFAAGTMCLIPAGVCVCVTFFSHFKNPWKRTNFCCQQTISSQYCDCRIEYGNPIINSCSGADKIDRQIGPFCHINFQHSIGTIVILDNCSAAYLKCDNITSMKMILIASFWHLFFFHSRIAYGPRILRTNITFRLDV